MTAVSVYPRDASWWSRPNQGTGLRTHYARSRHWPKTDAANECVSACGTVMLLLGHGEAPEDVPEGQRCGRPGCRQRWARWVS